MPITPPPFPSATSRPPISAHTVSTPRCSHSCDPVTEPTNVEIDITTASIVSTASGGRPPRIRHAIPISIAPAPIVTPATALQATVPIVSTATTGIAASSPPATDTARRSK